MFPRRCKHRSVLFALLSIIVAGCTRPTAAAAGKPRTVTLLVHGITWDLQRPCQVWGQAATATDGNARWDGMIGHLEQEGHRFGGVIRCNGSQLALPQCLDTSGVRSEPSTASVFALEFSPSANTDGISYKTLELVRCLRELRAFTGCEKVRIVAHSAGGVIVRVYLQNALPGVEYAGDVDRVITIGTPHLGAAIASHFGDFLGSRATSLKPNAELIRRLNGPLDLPPNILFASVVVRGIAADVRGTGHEYEQFVDRDLLRQLPIDYREGGDQVVHVCSQNLRLAECAKRYEAATHRPVHYILVRVPDPTPEDLSLFEEKVHEAAPRDTGVQACVAKLLADDGSFWTEPGERRLAESASAQAKLHAFGIIEKETLHKHPLTQVTTVEIEQLELLEQDGYMHTYQFSGRARWGKLKPRSTHVDGKMQLTLDRFGRINCCRSWATHQQDQ